MPRKYWKTPRVYNKPGFASYETSACKPCFCFNLQMCRYRPGGTLLILRSICSMVITYCVPKDCLHSSPSPSINQRRPCIILNMKSFTKNSLPAIADHIGFPHRIWLKVINFPIVTAVFLHFYRFTLAVRNTNAFPWFAWGERNGKHEKTQHQANGYYSFCVH